jgi:hypothetical protein
MLGINVCNGETMDISDCVFENIDTAYGIGGFIIIVMMIHFSASVYMG